VLTNIALPNYARLPIVAQSPWLTIPVQSPLDVLPEQSWGDKAQGWLGGILIYIFGDDTLHDIIDDNRSEDEILIEELLVLGLDIAGVADPTGLCDGASAGISLKNGEFVDAAISVVSIIPWIGDLSKAGKLPKLTKTLGKIIKRAGESKAFAKQIKPTLKVIETALDTILNNKQVRGCLPDGVGLLLIF
jgi:hypothetical protein